jgi:glycopeptide antibiotics resistance protein
MTMPGPEPRPDDPSRAPASEAVGRAQRWPVALLLWLGFALFVLHGAMWPFEFDLVRESLAYNVDHAVWVPFVRATGEVAPTADVVLNVLVFVPFGLLGSLALARRRRPVVATTLAGLGSSVTVESLQLLTATRQTSVTDVLTNTYGALVGALVAQLALAAVRSALAHPRGRRLASAPTAFAVAVAAAVACVGALQPFDVLLDAAALDQRVAHLGIDPFQLQAALREGAATILWTGLLTLALGRWLHELGLARPALRAAALGAGIGLALEAARLFLVSKTPGLAGAAAVVAGAALGAALLRPAAARPSPWPWAAALSAATFASAAMQALAPVGRPRSFAGRVWAHLLTRNERLLLDAASSALETGLIFLPLGFVLSLLFVRRQRIAIVVGAAGVLLVAAGLEAGQAVVAARPRFASDLVGALAGYGLGALLSTAGWRRWRAAVGPACPARSARSA